MKRVTDAELLDAIYADPVADAPRVVYMDYLQERGDPRGEFIALQLARADPRRQRELLELHAGAWLGSAVDVVARAPSPFGFERGFLATACLVGEPAPLPRELATVVELHGRIAPSTAHELRALQRLRAPMADWLPDPDELDRWMSLFAATPGFQHIRLVFRDTVYYEVRRYDGRCALAVNLEAYGVVAAPRWLRPIAALDGAGWRLELVSRWRRGHQDLADRIARLPNWEHVQIEGEL